MKFKFRKTLWRILGFDYETILNKTDYVLLKTDRFTSKGIGTYDNGAKVWRWTDAPLIIGKYCSIAYDVNFIVDEGFHNVSQITNYPLLNNLFKGNDSIGTKSKKEVLKSIKQKNGIIIGNDVWIGMGSYIMPNVRIGNGVTIAANSVVTRDVPDYSIVGGVPAKIISIKHDNFTIKELNKIAWWNWDNEILKERIEDFMLKPSEFIKKYSR